SILIGRTYITLAGLGVVAYVFGLRHGLDADHIAAIDNTTRKLMQEGKRPLAVGTWFSLGHSTIVVAMILGLVAATKAVIDAVPAAQNFGTVIGTTISGSFLWIIGLINLVIVLGIYRVLQSLRHGMLNQRELENLLDSRGFMTPYFKGVFRLVKRPWQIYPIGVLFGLGFDTASEVTLIAISVGIGVTSDLPVWMILVLPAMFTCGMVLVDTIDAVAVRVAYDWALLNPIRKIYYNLTVTVISVLVAFLVGTVELLQVLSGELKLSGPFWSSLASLDFETLGLGIMFLFVACWVVSMVYYRVRHFEDTIRFLESPKPSI
ncbi:MAG: HoxN/HupN/NixA family nickel/cobalt transporter, partial [Nitrososphaerales archaeon]